MASANQTAAVPLKVDKLRLQKWTEEVLRTTQQALQEQEDRAAANKGSGSNSNAPANASVPAFRLKADG